MTILQFSRRIRRQRKLLKLTLPNAAKKAGVSKGLWSKIESGKGNPTLETMARMAWACGFEIITTLELN